RRSLDALIPRGANLLRYHERRMGPAELQARRGHLLRAQRLAMRLLGALFVRRAVADDGLAADQRRTIARRARRLDRAAHRAGIEAVDVGHHVPAVAAKALRSIVGEPAAHPAVDGDAVVVVEDNEFPQPQRALPRARIVGPPLP